MRRDFDALLRRVESTARAIRAYGYLNTIRDEESGRTVGLEVRFQPDPRFALWDGRKFGVIRQCPGGAGVLSYLDAIEAGARANADGIAIDDCGALEAVLRDGDGHRS